MRRYDSREGAGPMGSASSASRTCRAARSASEKTATEAIPISRQARIDAHRDLAAVGDEDLAERPRAHRGMFPCFFGGFLSRLPRAISSPATIFLRVWRGSITSSTKPRSAAT